MECLGIKSLARHTPRAVQNDARTLVAAQAHFSVNLFSKICDILAQKTSSGRLLAIATFSFVVIPRWLKTVLSRSMNHDVWKMKLVGHNSDKQIDFTLCCQLLSLLFLRTRCSECYHSAVNCRSLHIPLHKVHRAKILLPKRWTIQMRFKTSRITIQLLNVGRTTLSDWINLTPQTWRWQIPFTGWNRVRPCKTRQLRPIVATIWLESVFYYTWKKWYYPPLCPSSLIFPLTLEVLQCTAPQFRQAKTLGVERGTYSKNHREVWATEAVSKGLVDQKPPRKLRRV